MDTGEGLTPPAAWLLGRLEALQGVCDVLEAASARVAALDASDEPGAVRALGAELIALIEWSGDQVRQAEAERAVLRAALLADCLGQG